MRHLQPPYSAAENALLNITSHLIQVMYSWWKVSLKSEVSEEEVLPSVSLEPGSICIGELLLMWPEGDWIRTIIPQTWILSSCWYLPKESCCMQRLGHRLMNTRLIFGALLNHIHILFVEYGYTSETHHRLKQHWSVYEDGKPRWARFIMLIVYTEKFLLSKSCYSGKIFLSLYKPGYKSKLSNSDVNFLRTPDHPLLPPHQDLAILPYKNRC